MSEKNGQMVYTMIMMIQVVDLLESKTVTAARHAPQPTQECERIMSGQCRDESEPHLTGHDKMAGAFLTRHVPW